MQIRKRKTITEINNLKKLHIYILLQVCVCVCRVLRGAHRKRQETIGKTSSTNLHLNCVAPNFITMLAVVLIVVVVVKVKC